MRNASFLSRRNSWRSPAKRRLAELRNGVVAGVPARAVFERATERLKP